jgi:hypothetical protein
MEGAMKLAENRLQKYRFDSVKFSIQGVLVGTPAQEVVNYNTEYGQ